MEETSYTVTAEIQFKIRVRGGITPAVGEVQTRLDAIRADDGTVLVTDVRIHREDELA
jgi:hypothetical protein